MPHILNISEVLADLDSAKQESMKIVSKAQREGALQILTRVASHGRYAGSSPVGEPDLWKNQKPPKGYVGGRFIANWRLDIGSLQSGTTEVVDSSGGTSMTQASKLGNFQAPGQTWISNNLPYAQRVMEEGHSSQTPMGSTAITVAEVNQILQNKYG